MKKFITALILIILITATATAAGPYVASKLREPFHYASCIWAKKIHPENIAYYQTREAPIDDGHRPCKICKP